VKGGKGESGKRRKGEEEKRRSEEGVFDSDANTRVLVATSVEAAESKC
jgi:hypothetical protein